MYSTDAAKRIADDFIQRSGIVGLEFSSVQDELDDNDQSIWVVIYGHVDDPDAEWQLQGGPVSVEVDKASGKPSMTLMP